SRIYMDSTTHVLMVSQNNGAYTPLVGSGSGTPGGVDKNIQFNNAGAFGGSNNFTWDNSAKVVAITGATGTAGIVVGTSYIQSAEGLVSLSASYQSIQTPTGGVVAAGVGIASSGGKGGYLQLVPLSSGSFPVPLTSASFGANDALLWVSTANGTS